MILDFVLKNSMPNNVFYIEFVIVIVNYINLGKKHHCLYFYKCFQIINYYLLRMSIPK